jgi:3',5'-cyclic-AMP phosphodiesterase
VRARRSDPSPARPAIEVFAVEPEAVQLVWRGLPPGHHELSFGVGLGYGVDVLADRGVGAAVIEGLPPDVGSVVALDGQVTDQMVYTLAAPGHRPLSKIATISDLHIGETGFGHWPRFRSHYDPARAHPVWCLRAALREIVAWGPDLLVVKGDLSHDNQSREYQILGPMLAAVPVPKLVLPGNHDGGNHRHSDPSAELTRDGIAVIDEIAHVDLPGLRVVAVNSVWRGHERGRLVERIERLADTARSSPGPLLVATHHQLGRWPVPTFIPAGVLRSETRRVMRALSDTGRRALVTSGHTHRHRRQDLWSVPFTEVGSPKDYPGTWAGYIAYEHGLVQTVRRVADPDVIEWTERVRGTVGGIWGRWAPGALADRCFVEHW